jgi:hypothetical protein
MPVREITSNAIQMNRLSPSAGGTPEIHNRLAEQPSCEPASYRRSIDRSNFQADRIDGPRVAAAAMRTSQKGRLTDVIFRMSVSP